MIPWDGWGVPLGFYGGLPPPKPPGCLQVKGSQTMNVISAIFALLGIVAFIVDLNLNGLYRSSFDNYGYLVLVKSHLPEFLPLGIPLGPFLQPSRGVVSFPKSLLGWRFLLCQHDLFSAGTLGDESPLEASMSRENGGMEVLE